MNMLCSEAKIGMRVSYKDYANVIWTGIIIQVTKDGQTSTVRWDADRKEESVSSYWLDEIKE